MKLKEIAERIDKHLKKFESDKEINKAHDGRNIKPFYFANADTAGRYVKVTYVSFQGGSNLTKSDAEEYLRWLDAGGVGKHYKALSFNERTSGLLSGDRNQEKSS